MMIRAIVGLLMLCGLGRSALAQNASAQLPSLALNPPVPPAFTAKTPSRWRGYAGGEGIGDSTPAGFATPSLFNGYDYAKTDAKRSYDLGRLRPYVPSGPSLDKANAASAPTGPNGSNALSNLRNAPANAKIPGTDIDVSAHMSLNMGIITGIGQSSGPR